MNEFQVNDMTCGHCVATITRAVRALEPEARVSIDLAARRVCVDAHAGGEEIAAAIRAAGYTPVPRTAAAPAV